MKKKIFSILILIAVAIGFWIFLQKQSKNSSSIESDTTINGDFKVEEGKRLVIKNNSSLTIKGNFDVRGDIECENGSIRINVGGDADINDAITCNIPEVTYRDENTMEGISLVFSHSLKLGKDAKIQTNGNVQLVEKEEMLAKNEAELEKIFNEAAENTGQGQRIGPFIEPAEKKANATSLYPFGSPLHSQTAGSRKLFSLFTIPSAQATSHAVTVSGKITVATPPAGVRRIVLFSFPTAQKMNFEDFELAGPNGRGGSDDLDASCRAKGAKGDDAFRMLVLSPNITVNNFTLRLGSGGNGGNAQTKKECRSGEAQGGEGGEPSNFKMIATQDFTITGAFTIYPGTGGRGGDAKAFGKDGGPSENGADANAKAGNGGKNNKSLSIQGTVAGTENISFGSAIGGIGGNAVASPGRGGDGQKCGEKGGDGGNGSATGGKGGDASLKVSGGATRSPDTEDVGGAGGDAESRGGKGGSGGNCDSKGPGGNGGKGGDADSRAGKGGTGTDKNGEDGKNKNQTGGDGGNGGDGCKKGKAGKGGNGIPTGIGGKDGKNLCGQEVKKDTTYVSPSPAPSDSPKTFDTKTIKAIKYQNKFLPVDQLIVENEAGCGADHWHAKAGVVKATDNSMVGDPGPQCGYGKVQDTPAIEVDVDASP